MAGHRADDFESQSRQSTVLPFAAGGLLVLLVLAIVARDYPYVGQDFRYYLPRLLDTDLHLRLNGFTVQWFTPTFGGGVPAFPNPQHLQFTVLQLLSFIVNPWTASLLTIAGALSLAGVVFYRFLRRLGLAPLPATVGMLGFLGNGFYIEHMIVGHVGYQLYPLGVVLLSSLTDRQAPIVAAASTLALTAAMMILHAGVYIVILLSGAIALAILVVALGRPELVDFGRMTRMAALAVAFTAGILAAKLHASLSMLEQFPRQVADRYDVGVLQALLGLVAQLCSVMALAPFLIVSGIDLTRLAAALHKLTGASERVGLWELDTGLSPVLAVALIAATVQAIRRRRTGRARLTRRQQVVLGVLLAATWVAVEATLARGFVYPWLKPLPILQSLHVNHRIASVFILPLTILGAMAIDRWHRTAARSAIVVVVGVAVVSPVSYLFFPARVQVRSFDLTSSIEDARRIRAGESFSVTHVADVGDAEALSSGASSLRTYEPLFGYANEFFKAETHPGDITEARDGYLNMTNPAGLVFPAVNGLHPFERIKVSERAQLEAFASRRQPTWLMPAAQWWLQWLSIVTTGFCLMAIPVARYRTRRSGGQPEV